MVRDILLYTFYFVLLAPCNSQANVPTLTPEVMESSSGTVCREAKFRCSAVNLPSLLLLWYLNGMPVAQYTLPVIEPDEYPFSVDLSPDLDGVSIEILSASLSTAANSANFVSIMSVANLSTLSATTTIGCGSPGTRSNVIPVNYTIAPPPNLSEISQTCSLTSSTHGTFFSLLWNPVPQNSADMYRILVSPEPSSACPREVRPGETYNCLGLRLGEQYTVNINASNCNETQRSTTAFNVQLEVPSSPGNVNIIPVYNEFEVLSEIRVEWQEVNSVSMSSCEFNEEVTYILILRNSTGAVIEQVTLDSSCCMGDACSTDICDSSFREFPTTNDSYSVSIASANAFGQSNITREENIAYSYQSSFDLTISSKDCMTTAICNSPSNSGSCSITLMETSQEISGELNSEIKFPFLESSMTYSINVVAITGGVSLMLRRNFTTLQFDDRLTTTNEGLIIAGSVIWMLAVIFFAIVLSFLILKKVSLAKKMVVFSIALVLLSFSTILWIVVGAYIGPQRDTCGSNWQSIRDALIITSFALSILSFLLATIFLALLKWLTKANKQEEIVREEFISTQSCHICKKSIKLSSKNICAACGKIFCNECGDIPTRFGLPLDATGKRCKNCVALYLRTDSDQKEKDDADLEVKETVTVQKEKRSKSNAVANERHPTKDGPKKPSPGMANKRLASTSEASKTNPKEVNPGVGSKRPTSFSGSKITQSSGLSKTESEPSTKKHNSTLHKANKNK